MIYKKTDYSAPACRAIILQSEVEVMVVSGHTTDPEDGGDPT